MTEETGIVWDGASVWTVVHFAGVLGWVVGARRYAPGGCAQETFGCSGLGPGSLTPLLTPRSPLGPGREGDGQVTGCFLGHPNPSWYTSLQKFPDLSQFQALDAAAGGSKLYCDGLPVCVCLCFCFCVILTCLDSWWAVIELSKTLLMVFVALLPGPIRKCSEFLNLKPSPGTFFFCSPGY